MIARHVWEVGMYGGRFCSAQRKIGIFLPVLLFLVPPCPAFSPGAVCGNGAIACWAGDGLIQADPDTVRRPPTKALDAFETDVSDRRTDDRTRTKQDERSDKKEGDDDSFLSGFFASLFVDFMPALLFGLPLAEDGSASFSPKSAGFTPYPYAQPAAGLYSPHGARPFALDGAVSWFRQDADLAGIVGSLRYAPVTLVGLEVQYARFREQLRPGTATLSIANLFVNYYRVRDARWALWWGLGAKIMHGQATHAGFALNLESWIYPIQPVSLRLLANVGFINDRAVTETMFALAGHWRRLAPFIGFQTWSTGRTTLQGLVIGLDVTF